MPYLNNINNYTISDLADIIGTRPTWSKLLATIDDKTIFDRAIVNNQVVFVTTLTIKELKELFKTFKNNNAKGTGRPKLKE